MNNYEQMKYYEKLVEEQKQIITNKTSFVVKLKTYKSSIIKIEELLSEGEEYFLKGGYISNGKTIDEGLLHNKQLQLNSDAEIINSIIEKIKLEIENAKKLYLNNLNMKEYYSDIYNKELIEKFNIE